MSISKVLERLNKYFSLSEKKRRKKENDIKEILKKLQNKENDLKLLIKSSNNKHEKKLYEIELEAVKKLIKKTKKMMPN